MGWSHGGYITLLSVFRHTTPFKASVMMVPVTNLVFRLSFKGPRYQHSFSTQERIQGLPFEKPDLYIERSPLYHVDKLQTPLLAVHVATNDTDVNFVEDQQIVDAAWSRKPDLAETKVYVDPTPTGERRPHVQPPREHEDARAGRLARAARLVEPDVTFFEWHLRPHREAGAIDVERVEVKCSALGGGEKEVVGLALGQDSLRQLPSRAVLIVGGTLIDGYLGAPPRRNEGILIERGRFRTVGSEALRRIPRDARTIEVADK